MPGQEQNSRRASWRDWVKVALLFVTLEVAVLSIEWAHWTDPQPRLTLVLAGSVLAGWLLARSRLRGWLTHIIALGTGAALMLLQGLLLVQSSPRFEGLLGALRSWWQAGSWSAAAVTVAFGVFLAVLTWVVGYVATWYLLRRGNPWVGAALGAVVVLVNLSNLPGSYYPFFGGYLLAGALLIAWCRFASLQLRKNSPAFKRRSSFNVRKILAYSGVSLLCLVIVAEALTWTVPAPRVSGLQTALAAQMLWKRNIEDSKLNVFASVPSKQPIDIGSNYDELNFGPVWHESDRIIFRIDSPLPAYWRVHVYDTYNAAGWSNSPVSDAKLEKDTAWEGAGASPLEAVTYNVTTEVKTDVLLMAGDFISADAPVLVHTGGQDIVGISVPRVLNPGESYSVTADFISPSPEALAAARTIYPPEITATYLQLPAGFPADITQLAKRLTRRARTPSEKVQAIDNYLSGLTYSTQINKAPAGVDPVDFFLFTQKQGFCLYFASAMSVILRSVGVPARLAVGYLPGPGEKAAEYIIRDKQYHAWVEVYFPGYGWVDVEATPGGASAAQSPVAVDTPWVSPATIEQSPAWNPQNFPPYGPIPDFPMSTVSTPAPASTSMYTTRFPFAEPLGRALLIVFAGMAALAVALIPLLAARRSFYRWLWHVDRGDLATSAYSRMAALAGMAELGPKPQQTPLEFADALGSAFPREAADAGRIAQVYGDNRFGGRPSALSLFEEAEVLKARCRVYDRLLGRLNFLARLVGRSRVKRDERK